MSSTKSVKIGDIDYHSYQTSRADEEFTSNYIANLKRGDDWNINNLKTIVNWLNLSSLYIVLLNHTIEHYNHTISMVTIWSLIISTLSSTVSLSQFSVSDQAYPTTSLLLKIGFTVTSIITTLLTGYIKIARTKENLDEAIDYQNKWMIFATELSSQLQLPINIRNNATKIIINSKDQFKHLFHTRFFIPDKVKYSVSKLLETEAIRERRFKRFIKKKETEFLMLNSDYHQTISNKLIKQDLDNKKPICSFFGKQKHYDDIDYIYDSSRLNIYFIFKDIIYNELKAFELYLKHTKQIPNYYQMKFTITPSRIVINFIDINSKDPNKKTVDYSTLFSLYKEDTNILAGLTTASSELNIACNATEDIISPTANNSNVDNNNDLDSAIQKYDNMTTNPSSQIAIEIKKIEDIQQYKQVL